MTDTGCPNCVALPQPQLPVDEPMTGPSCDHLVWYLHDVVRGTKLGDAAPMLATLRCTRCGAERSYARTDIVTGITAGGRD